MRGLLRRLPRSASTIVATPILVLILGAVALFGFGTLSGSGVEMLPGPPAASDAEFDRLGIGTSRAEIERRLGEGLDALEYEDTGTAVEPINADCEYRPRTENLRNVVQLCFRDDKLVTKRRFQATAGPPLFGG